MGNGWSCGHKPPAYKRKLCAYPIGGLPMSRLWGRMASSVSSSSVQTSIVSVGRALFADLAFGHSGAAISSEITAIVLVGGNVPTRDNCGPERSVDKRRTTHLDCRPEDLAFLERKTGLRCLRTRVFGRRQNWTWQPVAAYLKMAKLPLAP